MSEKKKPIRVAQVIGKLNAAGVESVMNNYYRNIDHSKIQFDYIIDEDSSCKPPQELKDMGARYFVVPPYQKLPAHLKALRKLYKENNYKIVHSGMNTLAVFSLFAAWTAGVPVRINHNHSTANKGEGKRIILKYALKPFAKLFATDYFACSEFAGRWLFGNKTFDEGKVRVFNNAIELDRFAFDPVKRQEVRSRYDLTDKNFVVGHVGRFMPQKNHDFLIDIFAELLKKKPDAVLMLVGDGELRNEMREKADRLNISDKVIFVDPTTKVEEYYQAMDVFCFPSIFEGLGLVAVEAQASGLPAVVSDEVPEEADITDVIRHMSLRSSARKWAEALLKYKGVQRDRELALESSKFNIKNESKKMEQFYLKAVRRRKK